MHRHGVNQRKLSRQRDQRDLLVRGQITSLILHEAIKTTEAKAKTVAPAFERLVTKAKQADLAGIRAVREVITAENAARKLQLELVPAFAGRSGGYTRIVKLANREGDNAPMVLLSLVLPQTVAPAKQADSEPAAAAAKPEQAKATTKAAKTPRRAAK